MARSQHIRKGWRHMETAKKERELRGLMREKQIVLDAPPQKITLPATVRKSAGDPYTEKAVSPPSFSNLETFHEQYIPPAFDERRAINNL